MSVTLKESRCPLCHKYQAETREGPCDACLARIAARITATADRAAKRFNLPRPDVTVRFVEGGDPETRSEVRECGG